MSGKKSAVQWSWRGDQNNWVNFDDKTTELLESEFSKGVKKIKVDKERFIDLSLSHAEILKNFNKLDDEDNLIGVQRRYDDELKRRAIRRVVPQFFDKETFLILGKMTKKAKTDLTTEIEKYGGVIGAKFTKKITMVLIEDSEVAGNEDDVKQAKDANIPVLKVSYIADCISQSKKISNSEYIVDMPKKTPAKGKRKNDSDDEKESKKSKPASTVSSSTTSTSTSTSSASNSNNNVIVSTPAITSATQSILNIEVETFEDAPALRANTQWMGTSTMESDGSTFPLVMLVKERKNNTFSGEVQWPTLNSAKTKFRGDIKGDDITWEEYEVIVGTDDVEVPMKYSGKVSGSTISGKVEHQDEEVAASISINKISAPPAKDFDSLKAASKFEGTCYMPYKFVFEITKRKGSSIEGEITWSDLNNAKTKVKGALEGDELQFEEYESQSNDVVIPVSYIGRQYVGAKKVAGRFKSNEHAGAFEMNAK